MRKRSFQGEIRSAPIALDTEFPIFGSDLHRQKDEPISFLHFHDCLELGYCYSGGGIFMIGEKILTFEAGDVSVIGPNHAHLAQSTTGTVSEWVWLYLDPVRLMHPGMAAMDPATFARPDFSSVLSAREHPAPGRVMREMIDELKETRPGRRDALRALTWQLMILLRRAVPTPPSPRFSRREYDRIAPALNHVARAYAQPVDVGRLAGLCHMSAPHFRRVFFLATGETPRGYWHAFRLRMAASLLTNTSRSILEIGGGVGFESLSSFNRLFLKKFKMAPRRWRASAGQGG